MLTLVGLMYLSTAPLSPPKSVEVNHSLNIEIQHCVWDEARGAGTCLVLKGSGGVVSLFVQEGGVVACSMRPNFVSRAQSCPSVFGFK